MNVVIEGKHFIVNGKYYETLSDLTILPDTIVLVHRVDDDLDLGPLKGIPIRVICEFQIHERVRELTISLLTIKSTTECGELMEYDGNLQVVWNNSWSDSAKYLASQCKFVQYQRILSQVVVPSRLGGDLAFPRPILCTFEGCIDSLTIDYLSVCTFGILRELIEKMKPTSVKILNLSLSSLHHSLHSSTLEDLVKILKGVKSISINSAKKLKALDQFDVSSFDHVSINGKEKLVL